MRALTLLLCVFLLPFITSCESNRTIVNGLDEKEANDILVYLASKNVDAEKKVSTEGQGAGSKITLWDVYVPESEATDAMALLNQVGLPKRKGQNLLKIFENTGLVPSSMQDEIRYQAGLAEQLASTIRKMDDVLDAEVLISFPKEDPLNPNAPKGKITASVWVKHSGRLNDPNSYGISRIKNLVSSSITGLKYDDVTVIPDRARFSETPAGTLQGSSEELKQYVNIWSIIIAKESVTRFRIIFFAFVFSILLLCLALIWTLWKFIPTLEHHGGFKSLFRLHPLEGKPLNKEESTEAPESPAKTSETAAAPKETAEEKQKALDKVKEGRQAISEAQTKDVDES